MKKNGLILMSALLVVALIAGGLNLSSAFAQTPGQRGDDDNLNRTIQVTGSGSASAQPDTAIVVVGVRTEADEASEALNQNNQQANDLIIALLGAGIAEEDIQTQQISLYPRYSDQPTTTGQQEVTGYIATNTIQVRIRDITNVGQVLDTAVQSGGNLIESISFEVSDQEELQQQAREAALTNARQKAEQLAALAGVQLGQLISIVETSGSIPRPFAAGGASDMEQAAVPVQPGTQNVQVDLQVVWAISGDAPGTPTATSTFTPIATTAVPTNTSTPTPFAATNTPTAFSSPTASYTPTSVVDTPTADITPTADESPTVVVSPTDEVDDTTPTVEVTATTP